MKFKVVNYPDNRLRRKAIRIEEIDNNILRLIDGITETAKSLDDCLGLASTQLDCNPFDIKRSPALFITLIDNKFTAMINPTMNILDKSDSNIIMYKEGCMSIYPYDIVFNIKRYNKILVKYMNIDGEIIEIECNGLVSRCIQHEMDHLNGKLYIDNLSSSKRIELDKKVRKFRRE